MDSGARGSISAAQKNHHQQSRGPAFPHGQQQVQDSPVHRCVHLRPWLPSGPGGIDQCRPSQGPQTHQMWVKVTHLSREELCPNRTGVPCSLLCSDPLQPLPCRSTKGGGQDRPQILAWDVEERAGGCAEQESSTVQRTVAAIQP